MLLATDWLKLNYCTLFQLDGDGRIEHENDPPRSAAPRFWLAGCTDGNIFGTRGDLSDDLAEELECLAATEPPFSPWSTPRHLHRYLSLLGSGGSAAHNFGLIYELRHSHPSWREVRLLSSDSEEGQALTLSWTLAGLPHGLLQLGFLHVADLWPPWCAALKGDEVASVAFTARLANAGAELGLVSVEAFRGSGLAAAATAGWSGLPALRSRTLFYSTDRENISSQRVAARLRLRLRGASLRVR